MNEQNSNDISFIELFKKSLMIFKKSLYEILFLTAIPFLALTLLYIYSGDGTMESILNIPTEIISIMYTLFFITLFIIFPMLMSIVQSHTKGESITIKESFKCIRRTLVKLFFALFLIFALMILLTMIIVFVIKLTASSNIFSSIIAIGFSCLFIKLFIDFLFFEQSIVLRKLGPIKALKYSLTTTKKRWWKVFNFYFLFSLSIFLILNSISLLLTSLFPLPIISNIAIAFIQSLTIILTQIFLTLLFLALDEL